MIRTPIRTVLVANRGEIALRVIRACRETGRRSVAIYTDIDSEAPHVRAADDAVQVRSYLDIEAVVAAAQSVDADAVHPGYGFLSERAAFAEALERAEIRLVGPTAAVMERMGRKDAAREIAVAAGVPVVPSYPMTDPRVATSLELPYPVLVKAAAGGGGKGMRIVRRPEEYADAVTAARREAASAFGDDTLLVEKYVEHGRHIEVQVLADGYGNVVHLHERDCSTQRRHQKVLEEAPAPTISDGVRRQVTASGGRPGARGGVRQRRHRRVPARHRHRRGLLPGDEHPAPGRAPRHRGHHRHRPGAGPARRRGRGAAAVPPGRHHGHGPRDRGAGLRRGLLRRLPAAGGPGGPGALAGRRASGPGAGERPGRRHVVRPDARQDHRPRPRPRDGPTRAGRGPRPHRHPGADHQHRVPAGAGGERGVPARDDRHRVAGHRGGRAARPRRAPGLRRVGPGPARGGHRDGAPVPGRRLADRRDARADGRRAGRDRAGRSRVGSASATTRSGSCPRRTTSRC